MKRDAFLETATTVVDIKHFHMFCGLGGGAAGFNRANPRVGNMSGKFRCIGGVDSDPAGLRDFERLTGTKGTLLDLFSEEQYLAFHGCRPPSGWREATAADIRAAAGGEYPNVIFLSPPCKGFSGLLAETKSKTDRYQALNALTLRGVWLMLEAFKGDPPEMILFENVPRVQTRGRALLDQIVALLRSYGYAVAETTHDCGELAGLSQSRKRFLLVARHEEKVPPFLYEPEKKSLQPVGNILGRMPLAGDPNAGPMHRVPSLQWRTWVRLALVEAGKDWRSLERFAVEDGMLRDYAIVPEYRSGFLGVNAWNEHVGAVCGRSSPSNGKFSIADPRYNAGGAYGQFGVRHFDGHTGTVTGQGSPIQGAISVADPRHHGAPKHSNEFRIVEWNSATGAITGAHGSGQCVQDPRIENPLPGFERGKGSHYLTGGHYGVVGWEESSGAVSSAACHDNGRWSVADPRMPADTEKLVAVIRSLDGTWHRPFTTLELAAIQSLVRPEETWGRDAYEQAHIDERNLARLGEATGIFKLDGESDGAWRERIGNAVPPDAAEAIAHTMGVTILLARSGETFVLSAMPIWVQPLVTSISVAH